MSKTSIEWTDDTWNPTRGCSRVSEGCRNCYAEGIAARFSTHANQSGDEDAGVFAGFAKMTSSGPRWTGKVELIESKLEEPLHWKKPRRVFVNSMSDLFHEALPDDAIDRVFAVMALCPQHTFQVLTKRPERMMAYLSENHGFQARRRVQDILDPVRPQAERIIDQATGYSAAVRLHDRWPLPNVWLGVSVEDQVTADERIPLLLQTPAAVRFVSYEPALGPVDFTRINYTNHLRQQLVEAVTWSARRHGEDEEAAVREAAASVTDEVPEMQRPNLNVLTGEWFDGWDAGTDGERLDWVIVGGESGPGARPFDVEWARNTIAQCKAAGVACFVKQLGAQPGFKLEDEERRGNTTPSFHHFDPASKLHIKKLDDPKGVDWDEWPADLRVREFPKSPTRRYFSAAPDERPVSV